MNCIQPCTYPQITRTEEKLILLTECQNETDSLNDALIAMPPPPMTESCEKEAILWTLHKYIRNDSGIIILCRSISEPDCATLSLSAAGHKTDHKTRE